jgi:flotillin
VLESLLGNTVVVAVVLLFVVLALTGFAVASRYKVAKPNEAYLITGRRSKTSADLSMQKVVTGGGVFVLPLVQQAHILDLSSRRLSVRVQNAVSKQGIKLNVDGVAVVKVGGDENSIRAAAQRFLSQQEEIDVFATEVLSGALRSIVGTLTVEEIIRDRTSFSAQVAEVVESSLTGQGLVLDAFQIQDVTDSGSYLQDLGRPEAARVQQEAAVAEAEAGKIAEQRRLAAQQEVMDAQRSVALREAEIKAETDAKQAEANAAGPLAEAAQQQSILAEREKVAEAQAALTERELDTEVRKPADAEAYRVRTAAEAAREATQQEAEANRYSAEQKAEADKAATVLAAEAQARRDELTGQAERNRRAALAEAVQLEGEATAAATLAQGQAEAQAMTEKADAFAKYNDAATLQMLVQVLPEIAAKLAEPMGNIDNLTVVSTDGAGAMPKQVVGGFTQLQEMVKAATGLDLVALVEGIGSSATTPAEPATPAKLPQATQVMPFVE